jgi:hypothetical protein
MHKIYISGQITGIEYEAEVLFAEAEHILINRGFEVVNPTTINHKHDLSWLSYMKVDIVALMGCSAIYMLKNWTNSKGAEIERNLAISLGYKIIYEAQE